VGEKPKKNSVDEKKFSSLQLWMSMRTMQQSHVQSQHPLAQWYQRYLREEDENGVEYSAEKKNSK
jgi:hypothetical protein